MSPLCPQPQFFNTCSEINSFLSWQRYELTSVTEYFRTLIKLNTHIFNKKTPIYPSKHLNFQLFTASILSKCYPAQLSSKIQKRKDGKQKTDERLLLNVEGGRGRYAAFGGEDRGQYFGKRVFYIKTNVIYLLLSSSIYKASGTCET